MAPGPALPAALTIDARVTVSAGSCPATATVSTTSPGDLLVALVGAGGPGGGGQTASVSGAGLSWSLAGRTNTQLGTAEVWTATAPTVLTGAAITATLAQGGFGASLTVIAVRNASTIGAVSHASGASGAPSAALTTTALNSLVLAVGNNWDHSIPRTPAQSQSVLSQGVHGVGDTYWVQQPCAPGKPVGTGVVVNDIAPATDRWNLMVVEIRRRNGRRVRP